MLPTQLPTSKSARLLHACAAPFIRTVILMAVLSALSLQAAPGSVNLTVVDGSGAPVTKKFRWMLEEDNTAPGVPGVAKNDTVSMAIHKSHAPVAATGNGASSTGKIKVPTPDASKRYLLSVLADGYSAGGLDVKAGQTTAQVVLNQHELPTAQINILAFNDNSPINNVPDAGEAGIPGCQVVLKDFLGGPILTDTFGNPLGTTYEFDEAGEPLMVDGAPVYDVLGSGQIYTDANGKALIKYLAMGKYGVQLIPPTGSDWSGGHASTPNVNKGAWNQTATIEGTPTVDAWVKANEPMIFMEGFGPGNYHVFFGFVDSKKTVWANNPPANGVTLKGTMRFNHFGRPSLNQQVFEGPVMTEGWVALNALNAGVAGAGLYVAPCDPGTGKFTIPKVPPGDYQLVSWDKPLDALFGTHFITVAGANDSIQDLGSVMSSRWFGTYEGSVFYDSNANGFKDQGEEGIGQQTLNLRWRDGTVYQSQATDTAGDFSFAEVFPFFKWLIAEVDFARFKPTGMTAIVDEGGAIPPDAGWTVPSDGVRNPQPQFVLNPDGSQTTTPINNPNTGNNLSRTELSPDPAAPLLLEAFQLYLNQNNRIDWGKINYGTTPDGRPENGGIAGIVGYGATRAETDPRLGVIDPWESGIPRVQVVLYQDKDSNKIIDDLNRDGRPTLADIDNYPLDWTHPKEGEPPTRGPEDVDRNGNGVFDAGDAIQIAWTDSWDDAPPAGSQQASPPVISGKKIIGSDNYSTWNQIREGVFDGGYCFGSYFPNGIANAAPGATPTDYLPSGMYIVQSCPPPGYLIQTEESFNVTFGDAYKPSKLLLPPELVGTPANHDGDANLVNILPGTRDPLHLFRVPDELSLFPGTACDFAYSKTHEERPIADMKWVRVAQGRNAAADFHVYTEVPKATRVVGFVLNDLTAEFNSQNPIFGEKGAPGWLPVSFRDWAGHEVARTYSDEYGSYEALVPSSISAAIPMPSGFAPNMLTLILNDPTMPDPANPNNRIPDPNYNPAYATTPWTLHYYPATFLYADTPIVPVAGFVGGPSKQLDVEPPDGTPVIKFVEGTARTVTAPAGDLTLRGAWVGSLSDEIKITARGNVTVFDPLSPGFGQNSTVPRDFGFGTAVGTVTFNGTACTLVGVWANDVITVQLPVGTVNGTGGQLMVTRADTGKTTPIGVTVTYESDTAKVHFVTPVDATVNPLATPIQEAIDAAAPGHLVIVAPSPFGDYNENPILWKPLRLQGSGVGTVINANPTPAERLTDWHRKAATILTGNPNSNDPFAAIESPGIMVIGSGVGVYSATFATAESRIDGLQIKGGVAGGGIIVWDRAANLRISNNRVIGNQGGISGGISLGEQAQAGVFFNNPNVVIAYNEVLQNGGIAGAGGIGIFTGATGYKIQNNYIMGNFTRGSGGGIGHEGLSPGGLIANNVIAFNEVFYGTPAANVAFSGDGGGIFISGIVAPGAILSDGAGSVTIINNLIQGNLAGAGNGGGIRAAGVNGADVVAAPGAANKANWYALDILNNIIVNNVAGIAGGGISLVDATRVRIINNTIARNDSTATALAAFQNATTSTPQGAGLVSHKTTADLVTPSGGQTYCKPDLRNNIFFENRSFFFDRTLNSLVPSPTPFQDLLVVGVPGGTLNPTNCTLTPVNPLFVKPVLNQLVTAVVIDEAGNNISVRFTPIGIFTSDGADQGNYHLLTGSPAINAAGTVAGTPELNGDFDNNPRNITTSTPPTSRPDIGADEFGTALSIIPPAAPALTVALVGPPATGAAPPATGAVTGPGVAPGAPMAPVYLNPLPGDPNNPLLDKVPLVDSDGDGNPNNDVDYVNLTAGDGFATMADGTELYTFGFSEQTAIVTGETAKAAQAFQVGLAVLVDPIANEISAIANGQLLLADGGGTGLFGTVRRNNAKVVLNSLANTAAVVAEPDLRAALLTVATGIVPSSQASGLAAQATLQSLALAHRRTLVGNSPAVQEILRGIGPKVLTAGMLSANLAAPTLVFHEGRDAYLDLSNVGMLKRPDLFDPHTVHFHGFAQAASIFDGEPMASISIAMGGTLRYYYKIVDPGTYLYHCHVEATEHMQMGMIGNLYVLPKQNNTNVGASLPKLPAGKGTTHQAGYKYAYNDGDGSTCYDVEAPIQVTGFDRNFHEQHIAVQPLPFAAMRDDYPMLNGRGYPDTIVPGWLPAPASSDYVRTSQKVTSLVTAKKGQRVLLRLSNVSETDIHSITVLGIPMRVVAKDARLLRGPTGKSLAYNTTSVRMGGGETTDVILDTTNVNPGTYLLYGTRLNHLSNDTQDYGGLMTEIVITAP